MATTGIASDMNNSVFSSSAYPLGRTYSLLPSSGPDYTYRNNYAGELGGLNQDYATGGTMLAGNTMNPTTAPQQNGQSNATKTPSPSHMWIALAISFVVLAFLARKFAPDGEQFALVKPNIINGFFLTTWIVLILVLLKQGAMRTRNVPILGSFSDLILSV